MEPVSRQRLRPREATPATFGGQRAWLPYLLLLPLFLCIGVFIYRSVLMSLGLSTLEYTLGSAQSRFIGLDNYIQLFNKAEFWRALGNSAVYTLVGGGISIGLGLALAIAVRKVVQLTAIWQVAFFLPVTATLAAMSVVWKHIFNPTVGALNAIVQSLGLPPQSWLQNDLSAMVALIGVGVWSSAGYAMVLFLAGLTQIPRDLYQAAQLDGANGWQQLRFLTLPLLGPTTLFVVIIITLRFLENFDTFRVLTDGGPLGATTVLSLYLFQNGFQFFNTGYASAIAMIFFVILIGLTQAQMRSERQVHY